MSINKKGTIDLYEEMHNNDISYGTSSVEFLSELCLVIDYLKPKVVLDYGCGKGILITRLKEIYPGIEFYGYDPAIEQRKILPVEKADLVINTDVLEHIPEESLPDVIKQIANISTKVFFNLHHALAAAILQNGENAHCTVKPPFWYYNLFKDYFPSLTFLDGHEKWNTVVLTFPVHASFIQSYYKYLQARSNILSESIKIRDKICLYAYKKLIHKKGSYIKSKLEKRLKRKQIIPLFND